jgi:hypothetical protein
MFNFTKQSIITNNTSSVYVLGKLDVLDVDTIFNMYF